MNFFNFFGVRGSRRIPVFNTEGGRSMIREFLVGGADLVVGVLIFWAIIFVPLIAVFTIAEWFA